MKDLTDSDSPKELVKDEYVLEQGVAVKVAFRALMPIHSGYFIDILPGSAASTSTASMSLTMQK